MNRLVQLNTVFSANAALEREMVSLYNHFGENGFTAQDLRNPISRRGRRNQRRRRYGH